MRTESSDYVVVDASVVVKWLFDEVLADEARNLAKIWQDAGTRLAAPHLMPYEVANALNRRVFAGEITLEAAAEQLDNLASQPFEFFAASRYHANALQLARRFNQRSIYDSHYLALAQLLECEFWTADERYYRAASPAYSNIRLLSESANGSQ